MVWLYSKHNLKLLFTHSRLKVSGAKGIEISAVNQSTINVRVK